MSCFSFRSLTFMLFIAFLVWSSSLETCNARRGKHWRQSRGTSTSLFKNKGKNHGSSYHHNNPGKSKSKAPAPNAPTPPNPKPGEDSPATPPQKGYNYASSSTFNVLEFGAKGDGTTDDTKAFQAAWAAACKVEASTIMVPSEFVFLVGPISFSGPYWL